ncbi:MAG: D-alanyl-D-alanine carboxypeptidase family protein [Pseudomonadota bacterium]
MMRLFFLVVGLMTAFGVQAQSPIPSPPKLSAKAYLLMDAISGAVLAEHNADLPLPPASLTKIMTSYLLAREISEGRIAETDMVAISENAWSQNPLFTGSSLMWIEPGKDVSIADLELGIIVSSGNDATVAVAEHIAGSEGVFVQMMNDAAEELGLVDTYYVNSHGLPDPDHMTTARDLALLAQATIRDYPEHYALYDKKDFTYNDIKQYNRNTLMNEDSSVDGLKTGYTKAAGYCLVASAERRGMRLVSVVMGTNSTRTRKAETRSLLNYGFRFFETDTVFEAGVELDQPRIWKGQRDSVPVGLIDPVVLTLPRGKGNQLDTMVVVDENLEAPLAKGDAVGTVTVSLDGETLYRAPVVALASIEAGGFFARLWDMVLMWIYGLFRT